MISWLKFLCRDCEKITELENLKGNFDECKYTLQNSINENDVLKNDNQILSSDVNYYMKKNDILSNENVNLKTELTIAKKINPFIEYLDSKYKRVNIVYDKRYVGKKTSKVIMDIRDFCNPSKTLVNDEDQRQIMSTNIQYIYDNFSDWGVPEFWQLDFETDFLKRGDCEDSTILKVNKIKMSSKIEQNIKDGYFYCLGAWNGKKLNHCFPLRINPDFSWQIVEATTNNYKPQDYPNDQYLIAYIFNNEAIWLINNLEGLEQFNCKIESIEL